MTASVPYSSLRLLLTEASRRLINCVPEDFGAHLLEVLREAGERCSLDLVAVMRGSIREGTSAWSAHGGGEAACEELHDALLDEAGDDLSAGGRIFYPDRAAMGAGVARVATTLGVNSLLVLRLGDGEEVEAALALGSAGDRDWAAAEEALFAMLGAVVSGVAQRERDECERVARDTEFQQARNLDAISKLSGDIAHDINDMLVPIIGHSEAILASGAAAEPGSGLEEILNSARGAADLTMQLIAFSQKQMLVKKPIDLATCARELRPVLQRMLGEAVELVTRAPEEMWPVQADRGQLEQVLINLCTNARDASGGEGELEITVENVSPGQDGSYVEGDYVRLCVRDHGCGIPEESRDRVFEPFYTTKGRGGAGLGLAVVQGIVEQHGGWLEIESTVGEGSAFSVFLPAEREASVPVVREVDHGRVARGSTEGARVLLVDDEPSILNFVKQMLEGRGYQVTVASSRGEAFAALNEAGEGFDLVFSDAMLPDGTGMDVILHARSQKADVRSLLSSGYSDDRALLARAEAEDVDFLSKPYSLEELIETVENALGATLAA